MEMNKYSMMEWAKKLFEDPTPANLVYAALELRLCMEGITYETLRSFSDVVPESVLSTWQPPQAVKALLEFEPIADRSWSLFAGEEEEFGKPASKMQLVGQHNALSLKWLRKHYNKLGRLLHVSFHAAGKSKEPARASKEYLLEVIADLEPPLNSTIFGPGFREVVFFTCTQCNRKVVCNKNSASKSKRAVCLNPQCGAEYFASITDGSEPVFQLMATDFQCVKCTTTIPIENRKLAVGLEFKCPSCKQAYRINVQGWSYEPVNP